MPVTVNKVTSQSNFGDIYSPIVDALSRVEDKIASLSDSRYSDLSEPLNHAISSIGKKVRPAVTILASRFNPNDGLTSETMAAAVELLHVATLIHDDTVDHSDMRRGRETVSSLFGRDEAVVLGDYVFAASATFVCDTGNIRVVRRFAETIMALSKGQMNELANTYNPEQNMEGYIDRIYNKTASLFATAAEAGAILSGAEEKTIDALRMYGVNLGIAFQLMDDILDIASSTEKTGKPVGNDILHGIITLPVLIYLKNNPSDQCIDQYFANSKDLDQLDGILNKISSKSVIDESLTVAFQYKDKAHKALELLPDIKERECLKNLLNYVFSDYH